MVVSLRSVALHAAKGEIAMTRRWEIAVGVVFTVLLLISGIMSLRGGF
jgi:hypothetical protein